MKKARGRLYNKKQGYPDEVTYGYFTKRDVLNFDKKYNQAEDRERKWKDGKLIKTNNKKIDDSIFNELEKKGYPGFPLKHTTKKRRLYEVKCKLYDTIKEVILDAIIEDDEVIDLYYGQCFLHAGSKTKKKASYSNVKFYNNKVFLLVTHFFNHNVRYLVSLKKRNAHLKKLNEYSNLRTYEPKQFIHRPS